VVESAVANVLPVRNSAMARRSGALRPLAIVTIEPDSMAESTRSGSMAELLAVGRAADAGVVALRAARL
jgi:hypothetical protein